MQPATDTEPGQQPEAGDQRPSVLFILPWNPDGIGGVGETVINLYRRFAAQGQLQPRLLVDQYPHRRFQQVQTATLGPVDLFHLPSPFGRGRDLRHILSFAYRLPIALTRLVRYLRRRRVRAINVHFPSLSVSTVLPAAFLTGRRIPVVLSFHGADLNSPRRAGALQRVLWRVLVAGCDAVVAPSHGLGEEVERTFPRVRSKLKVIHNGVDGAACRRSVRAELMPKELQGRRYIVSVGTFERKKGQDVLIEGFREIASSFPDLCLALVGRTGPALPAIERLARHPEIKDRVFVYPDLPHPRALSVITGAELFILPSRREPFGIVILEAASFGVPVVASRVGGVPEIIEDGVTGRLVAPEDPAALSEAIGDLLRQPDLAAAYGSGLRRVAETRFPWERAADSYAVLFETTRRDPIRLTEPRIIE